MKRLSVRQQLTLSLLWFSLNFQTAALLPIVIPAQLLLFVAPGSVGNASQAVALGALSAAGALIALAAQPLTGAASDRTTSRFGRRRPYVVIAGAIYLVGMLTLAWAPAFAIFALGFVLAQIAANVGTAAYQGLLPDRVPAEQRGTASGYLGLMTILGNVGSLVAAGFLLGNVVSGPGLAEAVRSGATRFYALGIGVLILGTLVTVIGIREEPVRSHDVRQPFMELWLAPLRHANFRWVFLTRVSVMLGLTLFLTFIEYYFANVAHVTNFVQSTAAVALLALGGALIGALTLGAISDRIGRVGIVAVASGLMTLAAVAFVIAPHLPLWPLGLVFGAGYGAYTSVDWALAVDSLPALSAAGKDLGVWSIASNLPAVLAPLVGSVVIGGGSALGVSTEAAYRAVFALAGVFLLLGAGFVLKVQETQRLVPSMR
ncbi:MAG TPA: MFS transporter [Candidatus Dormibacteraeota bacterium]|nr:MFS transporter [Candidatus Dormibacteraeota bacterium]